jgi:hypothetical protein
MNERIYTNNSNLRVVVVRVRRWVFVHLAEHVSGKQVVVLGIATDP